MCDQRPFFLPVFVFLTLFLTAANICAINTDNKNDHELQQLLSPFATTQDIKLTYLEKRFSLFLKQPQEQRGYLEYIQPDQLIKQVLSPSKKKYVIQQNQLLIYSYDSKTGHDNKPQSQQIVSLDDYPQFKQFRALFNGLLKGDAAQISQYYRYQIHSMPDAQTGLLLKPHIADPFTQKQPNINKHIEIIFHHQSIKKITMTGFGGERSELYFEEQNINPPDSKNYSHNAPATKTSADTQ